MSATPDPDAAAVKRVQVILRSFGPTELWIADEAVQLDSDKQMVSEIATAIVREEIAPREERIAQAESLYADERKEFQRHMVQWNEMRERLAEAERKYEIANALKNNLIESTRRLSDEKVEAERALFEARQALLTEGQRADALSYDSGYAAGERAARERGAAMVQGLSDGYRQYGAPSSQAALETMIALNAAAAALRGEGA